MTNNNITLAVSTNNHYVIMLAALLKSIEENHRTGEIIDVWIIEDTVSDSNKKKLKNSVSEKIFTLNWISSKKVVPKGMNLPLDHNSYPLNIFMRLFIPHFISPEIDKVLYMDVDMIMLYEISKLWNTNLNNYILAAVTDSICVHIKNNIANYRELNLPPMAKYFNSGLLLINTKKWRENNITEKVIDTVNRNRKYTQFSDQYGLNVNVVGQWLELDPLWNYYAHGDHISPYVIHFYHRKPFYKSYFNSSYYQDIFYRYLNKTEWKNTPKVGELKRYFVKTGNILEKVPLYFRNMLFNS